jgi:cell division protein FtsI/penicillin-binding protein 2
VALNTELRNVEQDLGRFRLRVFAAGAFVLGCFALLAMRLVHLQINMHDELSVRAENNRISVVPIAPNRGLIVDRNGVVLADNYSAYTLEIMPARVANLVAPEHLELMVAKREEAKLSAAITTAGALLLGHETPTVLGDFTAGPSHTLPTGGTGRFFSGLRVADFLRRTSFVRYDQRSLAKAASVVAAFAGMESLDAHGRSLQVRLSVYLLDLVAESKINDFISHEADAFFIQK